MGMVNIERNLHMLQGDGETSYAKNSRLQGLVEKQKLDSFNLPMYGPSVAEAKAVVKQTGLFAMDHVQLFHLNWDPYDDSSHDNIASEGGGSGVNVARCIRAVTEPLIASHFRLGGGALDTLFVEYASLLVRHLETTRGKYDVIVLSLKKNRRPKGCTEVEILTRPTGSRPNLTGRSNLGQV